MVLHFLTFVCVHTTFSLQICFFIINNRFCGVEQAKMNWKQFCRKNCKAEGLISLGSKGGELQILPRGWVKFKSKQGTRPLCKVRFGWGEYGRFGKNKRHLSHTGLSIWVREIQSNIKRVLLWGVRLPVFWITAIFVCCYVTLWKASWQALTDTQRSIRQTPSPQRSTKWT